MIDIRAIKQGALDRARFFSEIVRLMRNKRFEFTDDGRIYLPDMNAYDGGWFRTTVRHPCGDILRVSTPFHNLLTTEGRTHVWSVTVAGGSQISTWYLAPFSGNVSPAAGWTAANFTSTATETTGYSESTRVAYNEGTPASGAVDNASNLARFTANASISVYGFGLLSASAKSATTGTLLAAARDGAAPISLANGYKVDVEYDLSLTSS